MTYVTTERRGRVVLATVSNPPHALMTMEMVAELAALVESWEDDDSVGAVVLTGDHPDRFLAHFDVGSILEGAKEAPSLPPAAIRATLAALGGTTRAKTVSDLIGRTPAAGVVELLRFQSMLVAMGRSGVAYLAALNGSTMGGGCELSWACDFRYWAAGEDHVMAQPEILLGFPPGGGGTQRLARLVGEAKALEICLGAAVLTPDEALAAGVVTQVVPEGTDVVEVTVEAASTLARRSKAAVRATKRAIRDGASLPLAQGLRVEASEFMAAATTTESLALMQAYADRMNELGEVPAYDEKTRTQLVDGTFLDLHHDTT